MADRTRDAIKHKVSELRTLADTLETLGADLPENISPSADALVAEFIWSMNIPNLWKGAI